MSKNFIYGNCQEKTIAVETNCKKVIFFVSEKRLWTFFFSCPKIFLQSLIRHNFQKSFKKLSTFFLSQPNWFYELPKALKCPCFGQTICAAGKIVKKNRPKKEFLDTFFWKSFDKNSVFFGPQLLFKISNYWRQRRLSKIFRDLQPKWITRISTKWDLFGRQGVEPLGGGSSASFKTIYPRMKIPIYELYSSSRRTAVVPLLKSLVLASVLFLAYDPQPFSRLVWQCSHLVVFCGQLIAKFLWLGKNGFMIAEKSCSSIAEILFPRKK